MKKKMLFPWRILPFLFFSCISLPGIVSAQDPKLYFTHEKNYQYSNVETFKAFAPGDTIYGLLWVPVKPAYSYQLSLESYTIEENGERVVPVRLDIDGRKMSMKYSVPLSSGISTKKKSGLLKLVTGDEGASGFYFQVLPTTGQGLNEDWIKWFGMIAGNSGKPEINVTVGPVAENLKNSFSLDLSNGPGIYSSWGATYINELKRNEDEQQRKLDSIALVKQNKKSADSIAEANRVRDLLAESDKSPSPVSKIKKPALETVFVDYANSNAEAITILRAYIYSDEGFHSDHDYVVNFAYKINKDSSYGRCYLLPAKIHTENPLNEKEYVKEFKWYDIEARRIIRCSRILSAK